MELPESLITALTILYSRLHDGGARWMITGSLGMRLQGMDLDVHDIDLQTDADGAYTIQKLFPDFTTQPVWYKESERIRSHFGVLDIGGVTVEIMGDVEKRLPDGSWTPPTDLTRTMRWVMFAGMRLPVTDLEYEREAYTLMGRSAKAEMIRQWLERSGDSAL